jgi:hypothetical protein
MSLLRSILPLKGSRVQFRGDRPFFYLTSYRAGLFPFILILETFCSPWIKTYCGLDAKGTDLIWNIKYIICYFYIEVWTLRGFESIV